jgi:hypothetical protein
MKETDAATIAYQTAPYDSKMMFAMYHSPADAAGASRQQLRTEIADC